MHSRAATIAVGSMIGVMFMGSTIVTPLYSLYAQHFGFSGIVLTLIYAAYVIGNLTSLFFFGGVSDSAGRRRIVLRALTGAGVSALIFLFASGTPWLFAARVISGFSVGLAAGAGTAWIAELDGAPDKTRAALIAVVSNFTGVAIGPLVSGVLVQYAPMPLQTPFLIYIGVVVVTAVFVARSPETVSATAANGANRSTIAVPHAIRARFFAPAVTAFTVFSLYGFYFALAPGVLINSLHESNRAVGGAVVFELGIVSAATILFTHSLPSRTCMLAALMLLLPSLALLIAAQAQGSLPLLLLGTTLSGISGALGYSGSLQIVNQIAPAEQRAGVASAYFLVCFIGNSLPVIAVAVLTRRFDSLVADSAFAVALALLAIGALVAARRH